MRQELKLLTLDQAAAVINVDRETIDEWIKDGKIRFYRSHTSAGRGKKAAIFIDREDLNEVFND